METAIETKTVTDAAGLTALDRAVEIIVRTPPTNGGARLIPCLIGPTGAGKTARVRQFADRVGLPVRRLLLGTMLPEDVLGLPKVTGNQTRWSVPEWATAPCVLFLDELDKARPDVLSTVLTLLAERRVRDLELPQDTIIIAAMQPVEPETWLSDETGRALSARLVFLPVTADLAYINRHYRLDLSGLALDEAPALPVLPRPSLRQIDWICHALRLHSAAPADVMAMLWAGIFAEPYIAELQARIEAQAVHVLTGEAVIKRLNEKPDLLANLSIPELAGLAPDVLQHGTPDTWERVIYRVWVEGGPDDAQAFLRQGYDGLVARLDESNSIEVAAGAPTEDVVNAINRVTRRIADTWLDRRKK